MKYTSEGPIRGIRNVGLVSFVEHLMVAEKEQIHKY